MSPVLYALQAAHRLSPVGSDGARQVRVVDGFQGRYFYIVNGSLTKDPDIMMHEVKNYKMRIPPYVEVFVSFCADF